MDTRLYEKLMDVCAKNDLEIVPSEGVLLIVGAHMPSAIIQSSIEALMAGHPIQFVETFKQSSAIRLREVFARAGAASFAMAANKRAVEIRVQGPIDKTDIPEPEVSDVMVKDGFFDTWTVALNGEEVYKTSAQAIRACEGHNIRERIINNDDIVNIKILVESCDSVDELLKKLG